MVVGDLTQVGELADVGARHLQHAVAGLDPGNTGMLPGPVPDGMPELVETFFPDLSFRRPFKSHAGLFAVGPAVYAQALGEGTPVVEAQIRSGETRIMIEGKESVPGITANHLVTYKAGTDTSLGIIEGRELAGAGLWFWRIAGVIFGMCSAAQTAVNGRLGGVLDSAVASAP